MYYCSHRGTATWGDVVGGDGGGATAEVDQGFAACTGQQLLLLQQDRGGTVKKEGQKSSLAPGNASLDHLLSSIRLDS